MKTYEDYISMFFIRVNSYLKDIYLVNGLWFSLDVIN